MKMTRKLGMELFFSQVIDLQNFLVMNLELPEKRLSGYVQDILSADVRRKL